MKYPTPTPKQIAALVDRYRMGERDGNLTDTDTAMQMVADDYNISFQMVRTCLRASALVPA